MSLSPLYQLPDNAVVTEVERQRMLVTDESSYLGSQYMPLSEVNADNVLWEIRDNVQGLSLLRGADEAYPQTNDTGVTRFSMQPSRISEMRTLPEDVIERRRMVGSFNEPWDVAEELSRIMAEITNKQLDTVEYLRWQTITKGTASLARKDGSIQKVASWNVNSFTPGINWTSTATATPLNDFRQMRDLSVGYGHGFGREANAIAASTTWNKLLSNTNVADIAGKRGYAQENILSIPIYNSTIAPGEDVPMLVQYNEGYIDSGGTFQRFMPDGYIAVIGYHLKGYGLKVGEFDLTRNGSNPNGSPGVFAKMGVMPLPPEIPWVARGFNGGPKIHYTRQIVVMKVY